MNSQYKSRLSRRYSYLRDVAVNVHIYWNTFTRVAIRDAGIVTACARDTLPSNLRVRFNAICNAVCVVVVVGVIVVVAM